MEIAKLIEFKNWADEKYLSYVETLSEKQFVEEVPVVNKSIKQILWHMYEVYWFWFHKITDQDYSDEPVFDEMNISDVSSAIKEYNRKILKLINERSMDEPIKLQWDEKDKPVTTNPENILFNYVTHSAYHRGQIALLLRYHGFESIEETDYNPYIYIKGQE